MVSVIQAHGVVVEVEVLIHVQEHKIQETVVEEGLVEQHLKIWLQERSVVEDLQ